MLRERAADGAEFAGAGRVDGDDRRGFGEAVSLVNEEADLGIPFGEFFSQGSAAGDEDANFAAHGLAHLGEDEPIGQLPGER